ncbi:unnamed protein product [Tuber aestivum]|uniref:RanBP2-type domain-containing protein n=1 Tax=Tuber aestivum TaxID=59557 RepID=A0A292Q5M6_9PEZI|nr:unnamed protein product [Tuber aestivum]
MSSEPPPDGSGGGERSIRKRFTTQVKRVLSIRSGKSRRSIVSDTTGEPTTPVTPLLPTAVIPPIEPASSSVVQPKPEPKTQEKVEQERVRTRTRPAVRQPRTTATPPAMTAAERAHALFKKHGLEISTSDWPLSTVPPGDRVQRDIRMRVHRTCHKCSTSFGPDKICNSCNHKRCKKCPRQPAKKPKDKGKGKEKVGEKSGERSFQKAGRKKKKPAYGVPLTLPSRTGGQDLVRRPPRQRVHRKCHRCQTDFAGEKICRKCSHTRCKNCPREPFKKNKPPGYYDGLDPEDSEEDKQLPTRPRRTYKKPRRRVHWICTKCSTTFVEKAKICEGCGSNRDDTGLRDPPKKTPYKPTEEDIQRLDERLKQTSLSAA